jgi:RHS repeat-associated protein
MKEPMRRVPSGFAAIGCVVLFSISKPAAAMDQANRTVTAHRNGSVLLKLSADPTVDEIFRSHVFSEPLVPIGGKPSAADNAALAAALRGYANRSGIDDFSSLTDFLDQHPNCPWAAALLTDLGLEYYNTAHYSLALDAWSKAWDIGKNATDARGIALADRAVGELASMYARLGRMTELKALFKSLNGQIIVGPATEKLDGARQGLWMMEHQPEVSFRCGPLALESIKRLVDPQHPAADVIFQSASTQKGFSLPQVAELSKKVGLNYQMAFREGGDFVVPSVVHWKVGHYAALVRQVGDRYLLKDPTFRNDVWATRQALEAETSGYFLIPPGPLPAGWRAVDATEGGSVWGKGQTTGNDPGPITRRDLKEGPAPCRGMAAPGAHLMTVNLSVVDTPVGYTPPVGPAVLFTVRFNQRDTFQPANFVYANLGQKWTCDWISYVTDVPSNALSDVTCYMGGGGQRTFTGFNTNTQSFAYQQFDQTLLTRTATNPISYEMVWPDGSKYEFSQSDGSIGATRNIFLTQVIDPQGNAVTLTYDTNLLITAITDAIGQVTTLTYGLLPGTLVDYADPYKLTRVTDPFGRSATFSYGEILYGEQRTYVNGVEKDYPIYGWALTNITDEIGMTSQVAYSSQEIQFEDQYEIFYNNFVNTLVTPYGTNAFVQGDNGTTRWLETSYPDGSRDRVEYNQFVPVAGEDPPASVPTGMLTGNSYLNYRDTYYWSRNACATAYGDYTKAQRFHWLHTADGSSTSGILESTLEPLENRVWYDYAGQIPYLVGSINRPAHVGRVLDDGSTQLYSYGYNGFGHVTNSVDPLGRTFSYIYDTNGIDLLQIRQTRGHNNELLFTATYNSQHRPLTEIDAAGQTNTFTYNARGQLLTATDPKGETVTCSYDANGYLLSADGPLPGTNDSMTATYDSFGRVRTLTDANGYSLTYDYDNLDRVTRVTHPDSTFEQITYDRLDPVIFQDRAGRQTFYQYDNMRQLVKKTDPLNRVTLLDWCGCGSIKSLTDPMGHTTVWDRDVQGRLVDKIYGDGSEIHYTYENTTSRLRQVTDENLQDTLFTYYPDNTVASCSYANAAIPTPGVIYTYDPNYVRVASMTDGAGTTAYSYNPVTATPTLGAGQLAGVAGPVTNALVTYTYDELGRATHHNLNGVDSAVTYDAAGRALGADNALGNFNYTYDGSSDRLASQLFPNGLTAAFFYGTAAQDFLLQQISNTNGATLISQFVYGRDVAKNRITTWSQQSGAGTPSIFSFGYDAVNQLLSAAVTNGGALVNSYAYNYDPAENRLGEQIGSSAYTSTYNALNQLDISSEPGTSRTNEWDAARRLVAVNSGNQRTEFTYDGTSRLTGIRQLINGDEVSHRLFVWDGSRISEELDTNGVVVKRFFVQGVQLMTGTNAGLYYYTRDHLGSIRELTDANGNVRAEYAYDPFGRRTKLSGDLDADFGFAGMFWSSQANLCITHYRAYDPALGRWLSRDPLKNAEMKEGPNLYAYVRNEPVSRIDPQGLGLDSPSAACVQNPALCATLAAAGVSIGGEAAEVGEPALANTIEAGESCASGLADTIPPALADTAQAAGAVAQQVLTKADSILEAPTANMILQAPDYEFVGVDYIQPVEMWIDENGEEIFGEEAELLRENYQWANLYWNSAMDYLARLGLPLGAQQREMIDQILENLAEIRGYRLP